jgi:hypothetical protein
LTESAPATHNTSLLRKLLLTLMIVGASGSTIGAGTFASYNASTANAGNFDTGALALGDKVGASSTTCYSWGTTSATPPANFTNNNSNTSNCDSIFTTTITNKKSGDAELTVNMTLTNKGDLTASDLSVFAACAAPTNNGSTTIHGGGDPCDVLSIMIQETNSSFTNPNCKFPTVSAGACTVDADQTVADLELDADTAQSLSAGSIAPNASKYYVVRIQIPTTAVDTSSSVQGMATSFSLTWQLEQ